MTVSAATGSTVPGWLFAWARIILVTLSCTILSRKHKYPSRVTHHNDAASCTSVTRLLVKDEINVKGGEAACMIIIERIYAARTLTSVSRDSCQRSSNGWVVESERSKCA